MNYQIGSVWRIWDLHVHTPYSGLNNNFPDDFDEYAKILFQKAVERQIAVVGITDYFSIEGYKQLRALLNNKEKLNTVCGEEIAGSVRNILFLPNIELRTSTIVRDPQGRDSRVNFHVIFSDLVTSEQIEEDFLHEVKFTAEGNPGGTDEKWSLTTRNLEQLGQRLKEQHEPFNGKNDLYVGMMNAVVDHGEVSAILEGKPSIFRNRYLLALPADEDLSKCSWDGQGHLARKVMIQKSHLLFSSNEGTREFGLGKRHPTPDDFVKEFKSLKACVHGSDAHSIKELFKPNDERFTWINSDPTFAGFKRILKEPETRVFIGKEPKSITQHRANPTKYFDLISIKKKPDASLDEHWFDAEIPINTGLVAIIGNKGSGKSALADTLGLLGHTTRAKDFSFLNDKKFGRPRENKAAHFVAKIRWLSGGVTGECCLADNVDSSSVETIKYIPQKYLETICNEVATGEGSDFDQELKSVIFSRVTDDDRLGCQTFDRLIEFRTNETREHIELLQKNLYELNEQVASVEDKLTNEYRQSLEQQLQHKRSELAAHLESKPEEVPRPDKDPLVEDQNAKLATKIEEQRGRLETVEKEIKAISYQNKQCFRRKAVAEKLLAKLANLQREFDTFVENCIECEELGIPIEEIATLQIDRERIEKIKSDAILESTDLSKKLLNDVAGSPAFNRKTIIDEIEALRRKMDAPNQRYQQYLGQNTEWEQKKSTIEGAPDNLGTIKHYEEQLKQLEVFPKKLAEIRKQRGKVARKIHEEISKLAAIYASLYSPIQESIRQHTLADEGLQIGFSVRIVPKKLEERFFDLVSQGRRGTFCGAEEGQRYFRRMVREADFSTAEGALTFADSIDNALRYDLREKDKPKVEISEQTKKGVNPKDLADFIFGFEYLFAEYALTWEDMPIEQLSPGERGTLLLIFYLLVDKETIPLIIDQPEENLDNESVYKILVPCIKEAKERRQVIIVTHNPNLAVVCDADQVIYAEMDKAAGNRITYESGAIENPVINRHIIDVLEGTRPAFDMRDAKYRIIEET